MATGTAEQALQPQDLVLDLFAEYVRPTGNVVWSGGLVHVLEELGFTVAAARIALGRLVQRGLLDRSKQGRLVWYSPSARLSGLLAEGYRRIRSFGLDEDWDPRWTVLWYSIPEEQRVQRRRLARRLRFHGFGSPQDGTWVAPRDREADVLPVIQELGLTDLVSMFVGRPSGSLDLQALVHRAWDVDALVERYDAFVAEFSPHRTADRAADRAAGRGLSDREAFLVRTRAIDAFRRFPAMDPWLPEYLVGRGWRRDEAVATFHELDRALREPSTRYFREVSSPGPASSRHPRHRRSDE